MECNVDLKDCPHAEKSAELAVKRVFAILGVDVDDPEKLEEFRMNLRFGAGLRRASDKGFFAAVGASAVMAVTALGYGIIVMMRKAGVS